MIDFGVNKIEFRRDWFEQRPLLIKNAVNVSRFGWELIDDALNIQDPTRELLKVLLNGRIEPNIYVEEFVDVGIRRRRIRKDRLYHLLGQGATIVINRIELVSMAVREVCNEIGRFVGAQTSSNAYASFGREPATNVHWDTHDVFVAQIGGRKHWQVYEPTHPLPLSSQVSNDRKDEVPDQPILDEIIEAGDVLYVPRGWWHRVEPVAGYETMHLTVAVHTPLVLDYLVWACASILPDIMDMRHSLLGENHDLERVGRALKATVDLLHNPATLQAFYARSHQRERLVSPFNISALIRDAREPLDGSLKIALNSRIAGPEDLRVNGEMVELTGKYDQIIRFVAGANVMTVEAVRVLLSELPTGEVDNAIKDLARADFVRFV